MSQTPRLFEYQAAHPPHYHHMAAKSARIPQQAMDEATRTGVILFSSFGLLSAATTLVIISLILRQLVAWKGDYKNLVQQNQCVVLVLNLFLADFLFGAGAALGFDWVYAGEIDSTSGLCWVQAGLLQVGDLGSGLFVLALALQTSYTLLRERTIPHLWFCVGVVLIWICCIVLLVIGPALHGGHFFSQTNSWCWISEKYAWERLWLHYLWVFVIEFSVLSVYLVLAIHLHRRRTLLYQLKLSDGVLRRITRTLPLLALYPLTYIVLSLPIALSRMQDIAGHSPSDTQMTIVGVLLASCGWVDAIVYSCTRRVLIYQESVIATHIDPESDISLDFIDPDTPQAPCIHTFCKSRGSSVASKKRSTPSQCSDIKDMKIEAKMEWRVFEQIREPSGDAKTNGALSRKTSTTSLHRIWYPS